MLLARDGQLVYKTKGVSMEPMLRQNRDLVILQVPDSRLHKYDVALYRRGASYVLHRVIRVRKDYYLFRGDNTYALERVPDEAVIGLLTGFQRNGRQYSVTSRAYRAYARLWTFIYPLRILVIRAHSRLYAIARRIGLRR